MQETPPPLDVDTLQGDTSGEGEVHDGEGLPAQRKSRYLLLMIAALVIIALIIVFVEAPTDFESYITSSGYVGVMLMGLIGSASPIWPLPGSWAAFIAGGLGLNPFMLALAAGIGEPLGELTAYGAGFGGQVAVTKWKRYEQLEGWMTRHGPITIFLVSAIPNNLTKLAVVAAGVLRYPWWKFFAICWAGKTLKSLGFAMAGAGIFTIVVDVIDRVF